MSPNNQCWPSYLTGRIVKIQKKSDIVRILKIRTPEIFAVITPKFEQGGLTVEKWVQKEQSDLGLHCLLRPDAGGMAKV